jgi:hypothetical protein
MRARAVLLLPLLGLLSCKGGPPPPRVLKPGEAGPELVVVNYAPTKLRVLPLRTESGEGRYLLLGSERPGLPAAFRPLGVTERKAPPGATGRAGPLAWAAGHVVEAERFPDSGGRDGRGDPGARGKADQLALRVFDRDAKVITPVALPLGCQGRGQPLLAGDGTTLWALARCAGPVGAVLLTLSAEGALQSRREVPGGGEAELFLRSGEDFYLLGGRQVLRSSPTGPPVVATVPEGIESDARDLLRTGELLVVVDGAAGRAIGLNATDLSKRFEQRFAPRSRTIKRLRAVPSPSPSPRGDRVLMVWSEPRPGGLTELLLLALPLGPSRGPLQRILLGSTPGDSDHELVPVAETDGGGALLVRTHQSNSGPLVALVHLHL